MNEWYELLLKLNYIVFETEGHDITPLESLKETTQEFFKHYSPDVIKELVKATGKTLSPAISYRADYNSIKSPRILFDTMQIELNEPFQALLWSFCYRVFILYEMTAQLSAKNHGETIPIDEVITEKMFIRADNLFKRVFKSKDDNSIIWGTNSPNPSCFSGLIDSEEYYCKKANGLYMVATSFLIFHELGHYVHNDFFDNSFDQIQKEQNADLYAISIMNHPYKPNNELETQLGIALGVGSLLFFSSDPRDIIQENHPNTPDRIWEDTLEVLKKYGNSRENDIWWIITCTFSLFYEIHGLEIPGPFDYPKKAVEFLKNDLLNRYQP